MSLVASMETNVIADLRHRRLNVRTMNKVVQNRVNAQVLIDIIFYKDAFTYYDCLLFLVIL